jgi:NAD(P)-dependent dehydrogenase (short-subunit alcohol dehydrogenase family)
MSYWSDLFSLERRTALVIGGTSELCGVMAEGLAGAGAKVILVGRSADKGSARQDRICQISEVAESRFLVRDVLSRKNLFSLLDRVLQGSEQVDILINGAVNISPAPFLEISDEKDAVDF